MHTNVGILRLQRFHQAQRCLFASCPAAVASHSLLAVPARRRMYQRRCFSENEDVKAASNATASVVTKTTSTDSLRIAALRQRRADLLRQSNVRRQGVPVNGRQTTPVNGLAAARSTAPAARLSVVGAALEAPTGSTLGPISTNEPRRYQRSDCAALFDRIAPTQSLAKVDELLKRLEKAVKDHGAIQHVAATKKTAKRRSQIRSSLDPTTAGAADLPLSTVLQGMLLSTNPNNTLQRRVLEFTLGVNQDGDDNDSTMTLSSHHSSSLEDADALHSPHLDMAHMEKVLLSARERAILNRMCWNSIDACAMSVESRRSAAARQAAKLKRHNERVDDATDASALLQHLATCLPSKNYRAICNLFEAYVGSGCSSATASTNNGVQNQGADDHQPNETLASSASKRLLGEMALYNDATSESSSMPITESMPSSTATTAALQSKTNKPFAIRKLSSHIEKLAGGGRYHLVAQEIASFFFINPECLGMADARFVASQSRWDDSRDKFVHRIMNVQQALSTPPNMDMVELAMVLEEAQYHDDDNETDMSRYKSIADMDVDLAAAATPSFRVPAKTERDPRSHLLFEALPLLQDGRSSSSPSLQSHAVSGLSHSSSLSRKVFVDNLPIDIDDDALKAIYSRCGDLVSVDIFNRRPDLDPGPLSKAQLQSRQKSNIKMVGVYGQKWRRPCTPVYGLLTFADDEGSRKAAEESLRIFGTLVDRHPVRSIPSSKMTRLFIEGVPDGHPCLDFEYILGQALDPDLFVCLDAGQNNRAMVGSCEIKFPSFELAYQSFEKLQNLAFLEESNCTLNWIRSPKNAPLWWSRKLGFD